MCEVAERVVPYLRLALLTPNEIKEVERDNEKDKLIPVSTKAQILRNHRSKRPCRTRQFSQ